MKLTSEFTFEEKRDIQALYKGKVAKSEIAKVNNCSVVTINKILLEMGMHYDDVYKKKRVDKALILKLHKEGHTVDYIAKKVGCSYSYAASFKKKVRRYEGSKQMDGDERLDFPKRIVVNIKVGTRLKYKDSRKATNPMYEAIVRDMIVLSHNDRMIVCRVNDKYIESFTTFDFYNLVKSKNIYAESHRIDSKAV